MEYGNYKTLQFNDSRAMSKWYFIKPASTQLNAYAALLNPANTFTSPSWGRWFPTVVNTAQYLGLKLWVDSNFTGMTVEVETKYYVACSNPR